MGTVAPNQIRIGGCVDLSNLSVAMVVLAGLVAVFLVLIGLTRVAFRLFAVAVALFIGWTLLGGSLSFLMPWNEHAGTFEVTASPQGGWDVSIPDRPGATEFRLLLDDDVVETRTDPGVIHVSDRPVSRTSYLPGPTRKFRLWVTTAEGRTAEKLTWCAPVVFLAARGTYEDKGQTKFGNGMGSRGWRTWMKLAQQLGVSPSQANVLPTVVAGSPVDYPATVLSPGVAGYAKSRNLGKEDLAERIATVKQKCPRSQMILFGYSQGADVVDAVWQDDDTDPAGFLGVVSFADPYFNKKWPGQLTVLPKGGSWPKDGLLGSRGKFDESEVDGLQVWCLPGDPVCQKKVTAKDWHGWEYDCFEDWAAYYLAGDIGPYLVEQGLEVRDPVRPRCIPAIKKSKDDTQSYEPDPWENLA